MSDEALLQAIALERDKTAFCELFSRYADRLRGFVTRSLRSAAEAEELVQEIMLVLWTRADAFDAQKAGACTWIFRIARNKVIDRVRKVSRIEPSAADLAAHAAADDPSGETRLALHEQHSQVSAALSRLPEDQRSIVQAFYFYHTPLADLAQQRGIALGTVKSRLRLGLAKLRHDLQGLHEELT